MIHGKIIRYDCSRFYLKKKHFCTKCKTMLNIKKKEIVVNSESDEAENFDFSCADTYLYGNIKFVTFYFQCPNCKTIYEINELKEIERSKRKDAKRGT